MLPLSLVALLMKPFLPEALISLLHTLDDMARSAATWYVPPPSDSTAAIAEAMTAQQWPGAVTSKTKIPDDLVAFLRHSLMLCRQWAEKDDLDATVIACTQLDDRVAKGSIDKYEIKKRIDELRDTVTIELGKHLYFQVLRERQNYYKNERLFGDSVWTAFPSAREDIGEAGACLAFSRGTATVFHLMRVMEHGLHAIAKPLGIPYAPSWESYIKQMDARITAKHSSKSPAWKKMQPLFIELLGDLQAVKLAWRNPTMHITRNYTDDEAEEIFRAVKRFMTRVSEQFSEHPAKKVRA